MKTTAQRDRILEILKRASPTMAIKDALDLAHEFQNTYDEMMAAAEALAVLSEEVLGYHSRDGFGDRYKDARPAVKLAISHVAYRHGWVVCGPGRDGMAHLLAEWDQRWAAGKERGDG